MEIRICKKVYHTSKMNVKHICKLECMGGNTYEVCTQLRI